MAKVPGGIPEVLYHMPHIHGWYSLDDIVQFQSSYLIYIL